MVLVLMAEDFSGQVGWNAGRESARTRQLRHVVLFLHSRFGILSDCHTWCKRVMRGRCLPKLAPFSFGPTNHLGAWPSPWPPLSGTESEAPGSLGLERFEIVAGSLVFVFQTRSRMMSP